jgi:hypothetical protein
VVLFFEKKKFLIFLENYLTIVAKPQPTFCDKLMKTGDSFGTNTERYDSMQKVFTRLLTHFL